MQEYRRFYSLGNNCLAPSILSGPSGTSSPEGSHLRLWAPLTPVFLVCAKDAALRMEPRKEKLEPGLEQDQKPRLDSVNSSESFTSSGFQEDRSVSDGEGDEGTYPFLAGLQSWVSVQETRQLAHHFLSYLSP